MDTCDHVLFLAPHLALANQVLSVNYRHGGRLCRNMRDHQGPWPNGYRITSVQEPKDRYRCLCHHIRISYRATSITALLILVAAMCVPSSFTAREATPSATGPDGTISFDICSMWVQLGLIPKLAQLIRFGTFLMLLIRGLRNLPIPKTAAWLGLISLALTAYHESWRVMHCMSIGGAVVFYIATLAVAVAFLHHIVTRPDAQR